jgi:hypothetical protein
VFQKMILEGVPITVLSTWATGMALLAAHPYRISEQGVRASVKSYAIGRFRSHGRAAFRHWCILA